MRAAIAVTLIAVLATTAVLADSPPPLNDTGTWKVVDEMGNDTKRQFTFGEDHPGEIILWKKIVDQFEIVDFADFLPGHSTVCYGEARPGYHNPPHGRRFKFVWDPTKNQWRAWKIVHLFVDGEIVYTFWTSVGWLVHVP